MSSFVARDASARPSPSETPGPGTSTAPPQRQRRRWLGRSVLILAGLVLVTLIVVGFWMWSRFSASLPLLDGEIAVRGLARPVSVDRDALGVVTLRGSRRRDVALATGFVHAQDRWFQMDFLRRQAAGEVAALVGTPLLRLDRRMRRHRFRALSQEVLAAMPAERRALVDAYAEGVNSGLASLAEPPFEYLVLGVEPEPWKPEDTVLVLLLLFYMLQDDDGDYEAMHAILNDRLPPELFAFLTPQGTSWDAPMEGEPFAQPPIPATGLAASGVARGRAMPGEEASYPPGVESPAASNAWAMAGERTAHGGGLLAVDTHLGLTVPNIWYRARLIWGNGDDGEGHEVTGVTLPGTPVMVIGSNRYVAWGFSNARVDASDIVVLTPDPSDENAYLTPDGPEPFERHREMLRTRSGDGEELEVVWTRWGPLLPDDHLGRRRAARWIAYDPAAVNLDFVLLEQTRTVAEALAVAHRSGIPAQNLVMADREGHIAWTIAGRLPRRFGLEGRLPESWADGGRGWDGLLPPEDVPRIVDPPSGAIWTANHRLVGGAELRKLGTGGSYTLGARARHIRDRLTALVDATPRDMLDLQLDDRSLFLDRWRDLVLSVLSDEALTADSRRRAFRRHVAEWNGRASVDSVGYRLIREYRDELAREVMGGLLAACYEVEPELEYVEEFNQMEGPLWTLVSEKPPHLLPAGRASWDEQLLAPVDAILDLAEEEGGELAGRTWGARNQPRIRHFFSRLVPGLGRWLDMPSDPLPGDKYLPRVQGVRSGAALRMAVAPGREEEGIFHMPGGQSGHFLSPHFRDSHEAWAQGKPTSFLPGASVHTLVLRPSTSAGKTGEGAHLDP